MIILGGNAWRSGGLIQSPFVEHIQRAWPEVRIVRPALDSAQGAALLAVRSAGVADSPEWLVVPEELSRRQAGQGER